MKRSLHFQRFDVARSSWRLITANCVYHGLGRVDKISSNKTIRMHRAGAKQRTRLLVFLKPDTFYDSVARNHFTGRRRHRSCKDNSYLS